MSFFSDARSGFIFVALLAAMIILGGCYGGAKSIHDPVTNFSGLKSYAWTPASYMGRKESLVVANVQFIADQILEQKGFKKTLENPDLLISIENGYDMGTYYNDGYQLQRLTLKIHRRESKELIWQGTAPGDINTDAASNDLKNAVQDILAKFPPK
jgi:hypothetical protein